MQGKRTQGVTWKTSIQNDSIFKTSVILVKKKSQTIRRTPIQRSSSKKKSESKRAKLRESKWNSINPELGLD